MTKKNEKKPTRQLKSLSPQQLQHVNGGSGSIPGVRGNGTSGIDGA